MTSWAWHGCTSAVPGPSSSLFLSPVVWMSLLLVAAGILCWPAREDDDAAAVVEPEPAAVP